MDQTSGGTEKGGTARARARSCSTGSSAWRRWGARSGARSMELTSVHLVVGAETVSTRIGQSSDRSLGPILLSALQYPSPKVSRAAQIDPGASRRVARRGAPLG